MKFYQDDPVFYNDVFIRLIDSLKVKHIVTDTQAEEYVEWLHSSKGLHVPMTALISQLLEGKSILDESDKALLLVVGELSDDEAFEDLLELQR